MLEATKVSSTGHLYFIPRQHMDKVDTFETFIEQLSAINQNDNALSVNNFYIIDDAKQRDKMTEEFYSAVKKEIALYQEKADYLIQSGSRSPSVMEQMCIRDRPSASGSVFSVSSSTNSTSSPALI